MPSAKAKSGWTCTATYLRSPHGMPMDNFSLSFIEEEMSLHI